ncbi:hypothetical protein WJX73_005971 [Symbiochloris irregularis]|uniref:Uncharacterized protein n=1 Tax=Symbiochloris irregularis TaxID=706552 RepID=A0AAW1NTK8_9CHLO
MIPTGLLRSGYQPVGYRSPLTHSLPHCPRPALHRPGLRQVSRRCQSTSAKDEEGFNWDIFGWFKPKPEETPPSAPTGAVTKLPESGAAAAGKQGAGAGSKSADRRDSSEKASQTSTGPASTSGADWETEQPKADPVGYLLMFLTLLGLLFVTTSIFRYAGHFAAQRRQSRGGDGKTKAARVADSVVEEKNQSQKQKAKEQASRRVPNVGAEGSAFDDNELDNMRSVGDTHMGGDHEREGSKRDPTQPKVFVPGSGWTEIPQDEAAEAGQQAADDTEFDSQEAEEGEHQEEQDSTRDHKREQDDRDDGEDETERTEGSTTYPNLDEEDQAELTTQEIVDLAQEAQKGARDSVDEAIADKAGDDGNEDGLRTATEEQSQQSRLDAAGQEDDSSLRWASQDYSSYQLPAAATASAEHLRDQQQPLSSSAASAEAASLPKDASSKSLRRRAAVASSAARSASQAAQRATAYSAAASSAACKATDAADRAAEAAGKAHTFLQRGMARDVRRMEASARSAEKAAKAAEDKAAYPAAHATAHQEVATAQADLADQAAASPVAREGPVQHAKEWVQDACVHWLRQRLPRNLRDSAATSP